MEEVEELFNEGGAILVNKEKVVLLLLGKPPIVLDKLLFVRKLKELLREC